MNATEAIRSAMLELKSDGNTNPDFEYAWSKISAWLIKAGYGSKYVLSGARKIIKTEFGQLLQYLSSL